MQYLNNLKSISTLCISTNVRLIKFCRSSLSEVYVQVLDENDNNPYFVSNISSVSVMENSKIGTEITVIQAADSDSGDYGKITYLLDRMSSQVKYK